MKIKGKEFFKFLAKEFWMSEEEYNNKTEEEKYYVKKFIKEISK